QNKSSAGTLSIKNNSTCVFPHWINPRLRVEPAMTQLFRFVTSLLGFRIMMASGRQLLGTLDWQRMSFAMTELWKL
ncbi:MAG: hypothetical protein LBV04_00460, partial [Deferribacteraceae bacterium]|nr:hypothetical protein [Deferribacteraceae bacterium]